MILNVKKIKRSCEARKHYLICREAEKNYLICCEAEKEKNSDVKAKPPPPLDIKWSATYTI